MSKVVQIVQLLMHASVLFLCVCVGIVVLKTLPVIHQINATVTDADRVVLSVGGTAAQLRKASEDESKQIASISTQANTDLRELHKVLASLNTTVTSVNTVVTSTNEAVAQNSQALKTQLEQIGAILNQTNSAMTGVATVTNDPNLTKIMAHTEKTLANAETMTNDAAAVTTHYRNVILKPVSKVKAGLAVAGRVISWFVQFTIKL